MAEPRIIARVLASPLEIDPVAWNALLDCQPEPTPFMRHEYLAALHTSGSATPRTGWTPRFLTLWEGDLLVGACPVYLKTHSYGEYVFDWAWADAYARHGVPYYPKAVVAVPFTPVPGTRLLARDADTRARLVSALRQWCEEEGISSLHVLFAAPEDCEACRQEELMFRHTVQFHWSNSAPHGTPPAPPRPEVSSETAARHASFDAFLASLSHDKRKKIRQERRRVADAGVRFRWAQGQEITEGDWDFFYRCYERTYLEHGNPPYLTRDFFAQLARSQPEVWLLFIAEREGQPIASSLIALRALPERAGGQKEPQKVAYGRYWGAVERIDCLHFEACYYQPLQWCIEHGIDRFEGGAQGEHKMARALMPVTTTSAHWLAHPAFADAVADFLEREGEGVERYLEHLHARSPFKAGPPAQDGGHAHATDEDAPPTEQRPRRQTAA